MTQSGGLVARWIVRTTVIVAGVVSVFSTPVAAQMGGMGWEATPGHVARSIAHFIGILGGVTILFFLEQIRQETKGSTVAASSKLVELGTVLFILVFVGMEAQHLLGIDLWYFAEGMELTRVWWMIGLLLMMLLYTLGYRTLVQEMGG